MLSAGAVAAAVALAASPAATVSREPTPTATVSRACADAGTSVWSTPRTELRAAIVCLINHARARRGLPALYQQRQLDAAAQGHSHAMVAHDFFSHEGIRGSNPGARISATGFDWGAYGETISTGYSSAWGAVRGWLASTEHCQILLSPLYRFVGIGIDPRGVAGLTGYSGTWTADLALPLGWPAPSGDWGPASGCPY